MSILSEALFGYLASHGLKVEVATNYGGVVPPATETIKIYSRISDDYSKTLSISDNNVSLFNHHSLQDFNTADPNFLDDLLKAVETVNYPLIEVVWPRLNREHNSEIHIKKHNNLLLINGYDNVDSVLSCECNGLILDEDSGKVLASGIFRPLSKTELKRRHGSININYVSPICDGIQILLFYHKAWQITSKHSFGHETLHGNESLQDVVLSTIGVSLNDIDKHCDRQLVYVMELYTPYKTNLIRHTHNSVYIRTIKHNNAEVSINEHMPNLRIMRIPTYQFDSQGSKHEILYHLSSIASKQRLGVLANINNNQRIAIYSDKYRNLIQNKRNELEDIVEKTIKSKYNSEREEYQILLSLINEFKKDWMQFRHIQSKSEFAAASSSSKLQHLLFQMHKYYYSEEYIGVTDDFLLNKVLLDFNKYLLGLVVHHQKSSGFSWYDI